MPRKKNDPIVIKRNTKIVAEYKRLCGITTPKGKSKFSHDHIIETLEDKFYLAGKTIENIISGKTFKH
jgi:hypothetical protein